MSSNPENSTLPVILVAGGTASDFDRLFQILAPQGYEMLLAPSGEMCLKIAARAQPNLILLNIIMPDGIDGSETCRRLKGEPLTRGTPVIFSSDKDDPVDVAEGFRLGAVDYITKPFSEAQVITRVATHFKIDRLTGQLKQKNTELQKANEHLLQEIARREQAENAREKASGRVEIMFQQEAFHWGIPGLVGKSEIIVHILDEVRRLQGNGRTSVLITGESGTGKELIARAIHFGGPRKDAPFVPVNCSAIPRELAESILFGHVKGAFTGASQNRKGVFELADGGTLFLDEIGDMPRNLQSKLLRVLDSGCFAPVGAAEEKQVNVRILAATNTDLPAKIVEGTFRGDLYYRLAQFTVTVPPLRERKTDIPLLVDHFCERLATEMGIAPPLVTVDALEALEAYDFPGNVRELKNIIEGALIRCDESVIRTEHLRFIEINHTTPQTRPTTPTTELLMSTPGPTHSPRQTDEEKILAYVAQHGSINNAQCRELLGLGKEAIHRVSRSLIKMCHRGLLKREGESRGTRYTLP